MRSELFSSPEAHVKVTGPVCYLEAETLLFGVFGFRGARGGAVQGTAAATCGSELAAFPEHLDLGLSCLTSTKATLC